VLIRARVKLAEVARARRGLREAPRQRLVPGAPGAQRELAHETLAELLEAGLLEDAVTLAGSLGLDAAALVRSLTRRCLREADGEAVPEARGEDGAPADAWALLKECLARLDGAGAAPRDGGGSGGGAGAGRFGSQAFGILHRVAGETILAWPGADVPLPPWLKAGMRRGARAEAGARARFDTPGADAPGLLRLLLRYGRLEDAAELVCECLAVDAPDGDLLAEAAEFDPPPPLVLSGHAASLTPY
jgi:hypothetical protein